MPCEQPEGGHPVAIATADHGDVEAGCGAGGQDAGVEQQAGRHRSASDPVYAIGGQCVDDAEGHHRAQVLDCHGEKVRVNLETRGEQSSPGERAR